MGKVSGCATLMDLKLPLRLKDYEIPSYINIYEGDLPV